MLICFTLSMPQVGSWNGKWTGAKNFYAEVINFGRRAWESNGYLQGKISEFRLSGYVRSTAWIKATQCVFNNTIFANHLQE